MKYANKWSENAETAQQMEKNKLDLACILVSNCARASTLTTVSFRKQKVHSNTRFGKKHKNPGSSRKEIAKIHVCVTDAGWLPSKQAKTIHTAATKASHIHKHKQKQTDVNTHTHMHQNKHTEGKRRREEDGAEWWKWRWWEMTACLVLDLEGKPGEKRDESSFSETSWKPKGVHTLG